MTLTSKCGAIVLKVTGDKVELSDAVALSGNQAQVHDPGPETVDVTFANRVQGCQLTAVVRNGQLWTTSADD